MLLTAVRDEFSFHCQSRKLSPRTIKNYTKQIDYLLRFLQKEKRTVHIEDVTSKDIKEFLVKMSNFYPGHDYLTIRNKVIMMMLIDTGIRLSELTGLTEEQIKFDYIIIHGKGNKERVVPKSPLLSKWLIKYLAVRKSYFAYRVIPDNIFLSKNGKPLTNTMIDRIVKDAGKGCDVSSDIRVSAHTFRHTYAQFQLRAGLDLYSLSRLLGHESITITQTYLNGMRDKEVLRQAQNTSPLMNI